MISFDRTPVFVPYPFWYGCSREDDFTYLQQLYPKEAKKYQPYVKDRVDAYDYQGSMIYDAYPDRLSLYRLAVEIAQLSEGTEDLGLIQVLLYVEIMKRRSTGR